MTYTAHKLLGEGGYGRVYRGTNKDTGEVVAIKEFFFGEPDANHEIEILKSVPVHVNLPRFIDTFVLNSRLYLVTNFIKGMELYQYVETLPAHVRASAQMTGTVSVLMRSMLDALKTLHDVDVVHRDVKQENIMIDPSTLSFVLIDVGGACRRNMCLQPRGTWDLLMPELAVAYEASIASGVVDADYETYMRADVYALGFVLYEFVEDVPPYKSLSVAPGTVTYITMDFSSFRPCTYHDKKINRMIELMLSGQHDADEMIFQLTTLTTEEEK